MKNISLAILLAFCVLSQAAYMEEYYMDNSERQCGVLIPYGVGPSLNHSKIVSSWDPNSVVKNVELIECAMRLKAYNIENKVETLRLEFMGDFFFNCDPRDPLGIAELLILDGASTSSPQLKMYTCGTNMKNEPTLTTSGEYVTIVLRKGDRFDKDYLFKIKVIAVYEDEEDKKGLSGGAIAGIVIAAVLIMAVLGVTAFYLVRTFKMQCAGGLSKQLGFASTQNIPSSMSGELILGVENTGFQDNSPTRRSAPNQMLTMPPQNGRAQGRALAQGGAQAQGGARPKTYSNRPSHDSGGNSVGYDKGIDILEDSPKSRRGRQIESEFDEVDLKEGRATHTIPVEINPTVSAKQEKFNLNDEHYTCSYESPTNVQPSSSTTSRHCAQPKAASRWDRTDSYFVATRENMAEVKPWRPAGPDYANNRLHANSIDETMSDSGISSRSNSDRFLKNDDGSIEEDKAYYNNKRGVKVPSVKDTFV